MYIVCLVVWGLLPVGFAAKCVAIANDSHCRILVIVKKECAWIHRVLIFTRLLVFSRVVDSEGIGTQKVVCVAALYRCADLDIDLDIYIQR